MNVGLRGWAALCALAVLTGCGGGGAAPAVVGGGTMAVPLSADLQRAVQLASGELLIRVVIDAGTEAEVVVDLEDPVQDDDAGVVRGTLRTELAPGDHTLTLFYYVVAGQNQWLVAQTEARTLAVEADAPSVADFSGDVLAYADGDNDGVTTMAELQQGSDPADPNSLPPDTPPPPGGGAPSLPAAPSDLAAEALDGNVELTWPQQDGMAYHLYMAAESGVTPATYGDLADGRRIENVASPYRLDEPLQNGTAYYFVVTAANDVGEGPASAEASATPRDMTPPQLVSVSPEDGASDQPFDVTLQAEFSEPLAAPGANASVQVADPGGAVTGVATVTGAVLQWQPSTKLGLGMDHTATVAGVADVAGNVLAEPVTWQFRTRDGEWWKPEALDQGLSFPPAQVALANGGAIAAWQTENAILASHYRLGEGWGEPKALFFSKRGVLVSGPRLARISDAGVVAVWATTGFPSERGIWSASFDVESGWSEVKRQFSGGGTEQYRDMAMAGNGNGRAALVWSEPAGLFQPGSVMAMHYDGASGWSAPSVVIETGASPQLALNERGDAAVIWLGEGVLWWSGWTAESGWAVPAPLSGGDSAVVGSGSVTALGGNRFIVAWDAAVGGNREIRLRQTDASGQWQPVQVIERGPYVRFPKVAATGERAVVLWVNAQNAQGTLWASRYQPEGGWGEAMRVADRYAGFSGSPDVALDGQGRIVATWAAGEPARLYVSRSTGDGGWDQSSAPGDAGDVDSVPVLALGRDGFATVAWVRNGNVLQASRFE